MSAFGMSEDARISRGGGVRARPCHPCAPGHLVRDSVGKSLRPVLSDIEVAVFPFGQEDPVPGGLRRGVSS